MLCAAFQNRRRENIHGHLITRTPTVRAHRGGLVCLLRGRVVLRIGTPRYQSLVILSGHDPVPPSSPEFFPQQLQTPMSAFSPIISLHLVAHQGYPGTLTMQRQGHDQEDNQCSFKISTRHCSSILEGGTSCMISTYRE